MGALKSDKCSKGHPLEGDNLYHRKDGTRECRACSRERQRAYQHRKGAKPRRGPDDDFEFPPRPAGKGYKDRVLVPIEEM